MWFPVQPKPRREFAGFNLSKLRTIERAWMEAGRLIIGFAENVDVENDCWTNLSTANINGKTINVGALLMVIGNWRVKPDRSVDPNVDETVWGPYDIINGADSKDKDIVNFRKEHPGAGGWIYNRSLGQIVLFSGFFNGRPGRRIGFDRSRAVALIHEALHLQGLSDTDFEGGSRGFNTFVIQSCVNKNLSHNDLSIVVD